MLPTPWNGWSEEWSVLASQFEGIPVYNLDELVDGYGRLVAESGR
jgi:hypothetical protein